ncbi:MAG TPA: glycosyltransferase family 2 protein [Patescibacteria group bacterium]|nr:glycosyltransferase family 2 protein [Patescibacteria group bacterium]
MKSLSVIFPVYNERESIGHVLHEWSKVLRDLKISYELVVCEDGSTDGTSEFLRIIKKKYRLTLNQSTARRGYGGAVLSGIKTAKHPLILCVDSDGQCDPKDVEKFLKMFKKGTVLIGWRTHRQDSHKRILFSRGFKYVFSILFPNLLHDPSAPFVLFEKHTTKKLSHLLGFLKEGFWWGFVGACLRTGIPVIELPIHHRKRLVGNTQVYRPGKIPGIAMRNLFGLLKLRFA